MNQSVGGQEMSNNQMKVGKSVAVNKQNRSFQQQQPTYHSSQMVDQQALNQSHPQFQQQPITNPNPLRKTIFKLEDDEGYESNWSDIRNVDHIRLKEELKVSIRNELEEVISKEYKTLLNSKTVHFETQVKELKDTNNKLVSQVRDLTNENKSMALEKEYNDTVINHKDKELDTLNKDLENAVRSQKAESEQHEVRQKELHDFQHKYYDTKNKLSTVQRNLQDTLKTNSELDTKLREKELVVQDQAASLAIMEEAIGFKDKQIAEKFKVTDLKLEAVREESLAMKGHADRLQEVYKGAAEQQKLYNNNLAVGVQSITEIQQKVESVEATVLQLTDYRLKSVEDKLNLLHDTVTVGIVNDLVNSKELKAEMALETTSLKSTFKGLKSQYDGSISWLNDTNSHIYQFRYSNVKQWGPGILVVALVFYILGAQLY